MTALVPQSTFTDTTATSRHGHYTIFSPRRQADFLASLAIFGNVRLACRAAAVSSQTAYRARRASPGFALAWDAACLAARAHAEATLADRALNGVEEAVYYHGEEVARRRRYDARLLLAHLARLDRLEERAEVAATLPLLDGAIEALREGEALDAILTQECAPCAPSCGDRAGETQQEEEEDEDEEEEALPELERRLRAMEAARPANVPELYAYAREQGWSIDRTGTVEMLQLAAFEAGADGWWTLTGEEE